MNLVLGQIFFLKDVHVENFVSSFVGIFVQTYNLQLENHIFFLVKTNY